MKKQLTALLCGALLCPQLFGCSPAVGTPSETSPETSGQGGASAAYELIITGLQQELDDMQALYRQQSAAYEARIAELEAALQSAGAPSAPTQPGKPDTSTPQELFSYTETAQGLCITSYHGSEAQITVPNEIDGKPVWSIGEGAFRNTAVEQVIVEEGIREIGWFAFSGCYRLSSVILPASVASVEYGAFELCSSALRITCPAGSYAAAYAESYGIDVIAK